jgi:purine-nucleoside phosphorylase
MSNPFDYITDVSYNKKDIIRNSANPELAEKDYNPWITNKTLSYFADSVLYANEMNKNFHLSNIQQFDYFLNSINRRKRFSKQAKTVVSQDAKDIAQYYGYSIKRAEEALSVLTVEQIQKIKNKLETGG